MTALPIEDASQVGDARRSVLARAGALGWSERDAGVLALLVTEAGTNLIKHAGRGSILFGVDHATGSFDFLVLDRGPGIADPRAISDGVSTAGTAGLGLGALFRLATVADMASSPKGTALFLRYAPDARPVRTTGGMSVATLSVAKPHETVCGDGIGVHRVDGRTVMIVCDGLGHGMAAKDASDAVLAACAQALGSGLPGMLQRAHDAARHTRGAAVLLVEIDEGRGVLRCCGVGNISGQVTAPGRSMHLVSLNGTVGAQMRRVQEFAYPWEQGAVLVMHSDGLQNKWSLDDYPGWRQRHPMLLAGLLFRDCSRGRDDASVLVAGAFRPSEVH